MERNRKRNKNWENKMKQLAIKYHDSKEFWGNIKWLKRKEEKT